MKPCKHCGSIHVSLFTSQRKKYCHRCKRWIDWPLDKGQKPIFEGTKTDDES